MEPIYYFEPSFYWFISALLAPPILIGIVFCVRRSKLLLNSYDGVVAFLALALGALSGYTGFETYGYMAILGLSINPLIVGLLCFRRPVAFGLLTNTVTVLTLTGVTLWNYQDRGIWGALGIIGGMIGLIIWLLGGGLVSLLSTMQIAKNRRNSA